MKKIFAALAILCMVSGYLHAGTVSLSDAQNVAVNFFKATQPASGAAISATLKYTKSEAGNAPDFYVFDISPAAGFVIVAGDDNVIPILGYSTTGSFHTGYKEIGLQHWVSRTSANIRLALQHNVQADARISSQWTAYRHGTAPMAQRSGYVVPLCHTTWDQESNTSSGAPFLYNTFCPHNNADGQRCLTGCEATAMAQIMKFWSYPGQGAGSYSYVDDYAHGYSGNYGTLSSDFAQHTYQWSHMPNVLGGSESGWEDTAVAVLMYDCGVSIGMDFGDDNEGGSGAEGLLAFELQYHGDSICVHYALVKYFGYDPDTMQEAIEANYTAAAWISLIEHDLDIGRPILYEGYDSIEGGHAWVCDGYDVSDKLHMNWGWNGLDNGFFAINNLTTSGNFNPIQDDDALIGIMPKRHTAGVAAMSEKLSFDMYPNPASEEVALLTPHIDNSATYTVSNTIGQVLITQNAEASRTHIDIADLTSGIYFVELHAGAKSEIKKLVVSK